MAVMKSKQFIDKLKDIAKNYKTLYVMGCFGAPMTSKNKERYTKNHEYNMRPERTKMILAASDDQFGFDCVCLIKAVLWGWSGDKTKQYGGSSYGSNGVYDESADGFFKKRCKTTTTWQTIQPGEAVWTSGHIGVYIGDGLAVECTPAWSNKVQITAVGNIGKKSGYNTRTWSSHGHISYIDYTDQDIKEDTKKEEDNFMVRYHTIEEIPASYKPTIEKLIRKGYLAGKGKDLDLAEDIARSYTVNDRAGLYGN